MHIKVTRKSTEKALRLFYAQEPVTDNPGEGESLAEVEEAAYALLRSHVRAIDDTEDDLLLIYLEAALDYMEQLTNRVLGESDIVVYLSRDEIKNTLPIHKINDVIRMWKLEYRSKDSDDQAPWLDPYKMFEAEYTDDIQNELITGLSDQHFPLDRSGDINIDLNLEIADVATVTDVTVTFEKQSESTGEYADTGIASQNFTGGDITTSIPIMVSSGETPQEWTKGLYRAKVVLTDDEGATTSYLYFAVHDGTDFENVIITDRYPCYVDLRRYINAVGKDASYDNEDFARMYFVAGTDLMSVPKQYKQAALLLVGHYYNMREAENIGGITTEVKEGVHRLLQSVRQF